MQLEAAPGEVLVPLEETPTTGYRWVLEQVHEGVTPLGDQFHIANGSPPGAAGIHEFRLRIDEPGVYEVRFALERPWQREPLSQRTVRISVKRDPVR